MSFVTTGYGPRPGDGPGNTNCDLKIPHPSVGETLARIIGSIEGVTNEQRDALRQALSDLDMNFREIERHHAYFYRNCICHCEESGT